MLPTLSRASCLESRPKMATELAMLRYPIKKQPASSPPMPLLYFGCETTGLCGSGILTLGTHGGAVKTNATRKWRSASDSRLTRVGSLRGASPCCSLQPSWTSSKAYPGSCSPTEHSPGFPISPHFLCRRRQGKWRNSDSDTHESESTFSGFLAALLW